MINSVSGVPTRSRSGRGGSTGVKVDGQALVRLGDQIPSGPGMLMILGPPAAPFVSDGNARDGTQAQNAGGARRADEAARHGPRAGATPAPAATSRTPTSTTARAGDRTRRADLAVVRDIAAAEQLLANRLKTQRGELASLGHPDYGSRHHELIGQPNVERTRNLIKLYVLEALGREPRIEKVLGVAVYAPHDPPRDQVRIELDVLLIEQDEPAQPRRPVLAGGGARELRRRALRRLRRRPRQRAHRRRRPRGVRLPAGERTVPARRQLRAGHRPGARARRRRVLPLPRGRRTSPSSPTATIVWLAADPVRRRPARPGPTSAATSTRATSARADPQAPPRLTDRNPGSVVRTLAESFAREYAVLSRQLELVYQAAFLETAEGRDLDQVVALVGVERRGRTIASGEVVFSRSTPAPGRHLHPRGAHSSPPPRCRRSPSRRPRTARCARGRCRSRSRCPRSSTGPAGVAPAGSLTVIHRPILGVEAATNPQPIAFGGDSETDDALRRRASRALEASGRATPGAIIGALRLGRGHPRAGRPDRGGPPRLPGARQGLGRERPHSGRERPRRRADRAAPAPRACASSTTSPSSPRRARPPTSDVHGEDPGPAPPAPAVEGIWYPIGVKAVVTPSRRDAHRRPEERAHDGGRGRDRRVRGQPRRRRDRRLQPARRGDHRRRRRLRRLARPLPGRRRAERPAQPDADAARPPARASTSST